MSSPARSTTPVPQVYSRPQFAPVHPTRRGGRPVFVAGENGPRVTRSDFRAFQHPANTVIGDYPGFNEVCGNIF